MTRDTTDQALGAAALGELLEVPAQHLPELPIDVRIIVEMHGIPKEIVFSTQATNDAASEGCIVFGPGEIAALAIGVESERLFSGDLKGICLRKLHDASFVLTAERALDGAQPEPGAAWPLRRVLEALELQLIGAQLLLPSVSLTPQYERDHPDDREATAA